MAATMDVTSVLDKAVEAAYHEGFRDDALVEAVAIGMSESGGYFDRNNAGLNRDGSVDYGFWNINSVHGPDLTQVYDPYYNARLAYGLWKRKGGFGDWSDFNNGRYRRWMSAAQEAVARYDGGTTADPNAAQGTWDTATPGRTGRMRAEKLLSTLATAVRTRAGQVSEVSLTPADMREAPKPLEADDTDPLGELNAVVRWQLSEPAQPVVAATEAGEEQAPAATGEAWQGIPDVDLAEWLKTGLHENAARGAAIARAFGFTGSILGVGQRGNASDHPHGNADDFMTLDDVDTGWQIANYFLANHDELGVKYIIFQGKIIGGSRGWDDWRDYRHPAGRTDATALHMDHVHTSFFGES